MCLAQPHSCSPPTFLDQISLKKHLSTVSIFDSFHKSLNYSFVWHFLGIFESFLLFVIFTTFWIMTVISSVKNQNGRKISWWLRHSLDKVLNRNKHFAYYVHTLMISKRLRYEMNTTQTKFYQQLTKILLARISTSQKLRGTRHDNAKLILCYNKRSQCSLDTG